MRHLSPQLHEKSCPCPPSMAKQLPQGHSQSKRLLYFENMSQEAHGSLLKSPGIYPSELKNCFLAVSVLSQIFHPLSRLAYRQWSLAPVEKSEKPPGQIPNF